MSQDYGFCAQGRDTNLARMPQTGSDLPFRAPERRSRDSLYFGGLTAPSQVRAGVGGYLYATEGGSEWLYVQTRTLGLATESDMTQTHPVRSLGLITLALLSPLLVACGGEDGATFTSEASKPGPLESAYESCEERLGAEADGDPLMAQGATLSSDGKSVIIDSSTSEQAAASSTACILDETDGSEALVANIDSTTAMMGRQSDTYNGIEITWSYSGVEGAGGFQATFTEDES